MILKLTKTFFGVIAYKLDYSTRPYKWWLLSKYEFQNFYNIIKSNKFFDPRIFSWSNSYKIFQTSNDNPSGIAYNVKRKAQISVPSRTVFGDREFPAEFSILTTLKVKKRAAGGNPRFLFSLLHKTGFTQLGLEVDANPRFVYKVNIWYKFIFWSIQLSLSNIFDRIISRSFFLVKFLVLLSLNVETLLIKITNK